MNLFENLQMMKENSTFESQVDYEVLKQNDIDFFENGAGVYRVVTPDGDTLDMDIILSNGPVDRPKYFVSLPSEDVKSVDVDLTTAIIDVVNKLNNFPMSKGPKRKSINESIDKDKLWTNFNRHYDGFIPLKDLTNYFSLDQFGEFIQWCRKEADLDYDYEKKYSNWSEIYKEIDDIWDSEDIESISVENVFNFFTTSDLEEFWNWVEKEYDLDDEELEESIKIEEFSNISTKLLQEIIDNFDNPKELLNFLINFLDDTIIEKMYVELFGELIEATSGIGGAYTTKAIDMIPVGVKKVKEVKESLYDEYLERVMDETSNVELVNLLHEIRDNEELKSDDKKKLEDEIRTKVKSIKTEAITEFYGKDWTDEEIKKAIEVVKENPEAVGYIDPDECASPFNYNGKTYYAVGEGKEIVFDGKDCVVFLTADEELNRYLSYFEVSYEDEGDGESGPQEPTMTFASDIPYKVIEV